MNFLLTIEAACALPARGVAGCGKLLSAIHDPAAIRKVLGAMGLSAEVPVLALARSPPQQAELPWE